MFKSLFSTVTGGSQSSSNDTKALRELLESMIRALVDNPNDVDLQERDHNDEHIAFELRVAKSDLGKVIGRNGRTASAMRTILSAASRKHRVNADLTIVE